MEHGAWSEERRTGSSLFGMNSRELIDFTGFASSRIVILLFVVPIPFSWQNPGIIQLPHFAANGAN
jgi:hypothetical protein